MRHTIRIVCEECGSSGDAWQIREDAAPAGLEVAGFCEYCNSCGYRKYWLVVDERMVFSKTERR